MNSRRNFLVSLPMLTAGVVSSQASTSACGDSARSISDIKKSLVFPAEWTEGIFAGRKFLFALVVLPTDNESYIDVHGWIFNEYREEWHRFLKANTRNLGDAKLSFDIHAGVVAVRGAANNDLNAVDILRFDLRATSSDAGYKRQRRA